MDFKKKDMYKRLRLAYLLDITATQIRQGKDTKTRIARFDILTKALKSEMMLEDMHAFLIGRTLVRLK